MELISLHELDQLRRPTAQSGWPRNYCFTLGQIISVRLKSRPKFETDRPITYHDPGNISPRSAKLQPFHTTPRTTMPREPGNKASRPRNPLRVPRPMHPSEPGKNVPRPAEKPSAKSSVRPRRPTVNHPATTVPLAHDPTVRPIVPTDRPNAAVDPKT
ncbi:unnamed protein product [Microthlaspi erraticum]|uniref:Uncharacterized protein n=1 Tax=Microthlaspi erraticum TaxID=1685480 RepID=A0A6D2J671_9BRAS|nr:unnamed protein product [Microthlaspi erraticum]